MASFPEQFLALAMAQRGKPYQLGAAGPDKFDCSGLVLYCWEKLTGIECPHNDRSQWDWWGQHPELGTRYDRVSMGGPQNLQPGDLMWPGGDGHEMIVVNSTTYLQAPYTGAVVSLATLDWNLLDHNHGGYRAGRFCRMHPPGWTPVPKPIEEEKEMAIEKSPEAVTMWDFTCYMMAATKAIVYLDITNKDSRPINVTLDLIGPTGGRKTLKDIVTIQPHSDVGKPDFVAFDLGKKLGEPNVGNAHVTVTADGKFTAKATE